MHTPGSNAIEALQIQSIAIPELWAGAIDGFVIGNPVIAIAPETSGKKVRKHDLCLNITLTIDFAR